MGITESFNAVALNFPIKDFFVNVGEHDASRELGEVSITLDERTGIQNDCVFQNVLGHLGSKGSAKLALDLKSVEIEIETDGCKLNPLPQLGAIPENTLAIALGDHDKGFLDIIGLRFGLRLDNVLAVAGALSAVEDIALGDFVVALAHEFLLHEVLHIFDVDECGVAGADALAHSAGNRCGGLGVFFHGEERAATGSFNFRFHPGDNSPITTDQPNIHRLDL